MTSHSVKNTAEKLFVVASGAPEGPGYEWERIKKIFYSTNITNVIDFIVNYN